MQNDTSEANVVPGTVCPTNTVNDLVAQSVPSASLVPCVSLFGGRWSVDGEDFTSARHHGVDDRSQLGRRHVERRPAPRACNTRS